MRFFMLRGRTMDDYFELKVEASMEYYCTCGLYGSISQYRPGEMEMQGIEIIYFRFSYELLG